MSVQKIDYPNSGGPGDGPNPRIETGAVQFGDDWPGLFIRGDNAMALLLAVETLAGQISKHPQVREDPIIGYSLSQLAGIAEIIRDDVIQ